MTGFFDYRFKKGIKDVQTFTLNDQEKTVISACIALSGGRFEGGGGDSSNCIIALIGDQAYGSGSIKYYEYSYSTDLISGKSHRKIEVDKPMHDYQHLEAIQRDRERNICIATVQTADGPQQVELTHSGTHIFDKTLLGELYLPTDLLVEDISSDVARSLEETLLAPDNYDDTQVHLQAVELLIAEGSMIQAERVILGTEFSGYHGLSHPPLSPTPELDRHLGELLAHRISDYEQSGRADQKSLSNSHRMIDQIHDQQLKQEIGSRLFDYYIAHRSSLEGSMEIVQQLDLDRSDYYQRIFDAYHPLFDLSYTDSDALNVDQHFERIDRLAGNDPSNYQKLYDHFVQQGGAWSYLVSWKDTQKQITTTIDFFDKRGIDIRDTLFPSGYQFDTDISWEAIYKQLGEIIELSQETDWIDRQQIDEFVYTNRATIQAAMPTDLPAYKNDRDRLRTYCHWLQVEFDIDYPEVYYDLLVVTIGHDPDQLQTVLLDQHSHHPDLLSTIIDKAYHTQKFGLLDLLAEHGCEIPVDYLLGRASHWFKQGKNLKKLEKYISSHPSLDTDKYREIVFATDHAEQKLSEDPYAHRNYLPYASDECLHTIMQLCLDPDSSLFADYRDPDLITGNMLTAISDQLGCSPSYINQLAQQLYTSQLYDQLLILVKSDGLKIDKQLISNRTIELIQSDDLKTAEQLIKAAGLEEKLLKHIIIHKMEQGDDLRKYEQAISKDKQLHRLYHIYKLNKYIEQGELTDALTYASKNDLRISPQQFDRYREVRRKERQQAQAKKLQQEKQAREEEKQRQQLAQQMQTSLTEGRYLVDIDRQENQKYVFGYTDHQGPILLSRPLERHKDIVHNLGRNDQEILGGGWIKLDDQAKQITLWGGSGDYGKVDSEFFGIVRQMLASTYPEYEIVHA